MKIVKILIAILIHVTTFNLIAQEHLTPDLLLNNLVGKWLLKGTIDTKKTTHDVNIAWVLQHQYLRITEVSREKDSLGRPEYTAIVYLTWEERIKEYSCLWLDNTGNSGLSAAVVGHAAFNGNKIELIFNSPDGSDFHTTFAFEPKSTTWQWTMDGESDGKLVPFAHVQLSKQ